MNSQLPLLPPAPVTSITITVPGEPVPKGRHRARIVQPRNKAPFIHFYQDAETEKYEARVKQEAMLVMKGRGLITGALEVQVTAFVGVPASWSRTKQMQSIQGIIRPISRPDADNYLKCVLDAMNDVVYHDDAQVVSMLVSKWYAETPRLDITILAA